MIVSMTGFGAARHESEALTVSAEVRSVNNRHLKLSVRSSEVYGGLDTRVEQLVRQHIHRGSVNVQIYVERLRPTDSYVINQEVLESYRRQVEAIQRKWSIDEQVSLSTLLALEGVVCESAGRSGDLEADWPVIGQTLEDALRQLAQMRIEEGAALAADLKANCDEISNQLDAIDARMPEVTEQYRTRLLDRIGRILQQHDVTIDPAHVIREITLFADRCDVSEEVVRLRSHLQQFSATVELSESSGRRLEFVSQEMSREANTIGSKASDVVVPLHVVQIKAAIERIREQVQNVE